jgi:hypothetical protein
LSEKAPLKMHQKIYFGSQQPRRSFSQELRQLIVQCLSLTLFLKPFLGVIYQQILLAQVVLSLDLVEFHLGNQEYQVAALELGVVDLGNLDGMMEPRKGYHATALELGVVDLENLDETTEQMKGYHVTALELGVVDLGNLDEMMEPMTVLNYGHC